MENVNKHIMTRTRTNKKGEEITYCYDTKQYYENYKEKRGHGVCDVCGAVVMDQYLNKHKSTKKCAQISTIIQKLKNKQ